MVYLLLFLFCVVFIEFFILLHVSGNIRSVMAFSRTGIGALKAYKMDDDEKGIFFRHQSWELFKATFVLSIKFLSVFLILSAIYVTLNYFFPEMGDALLKEINSVTVLVILTVVTMFYVRMRMSFTKNYNFIERLLHHLAFSTPFVQKKLVEIENDLFKNRIKGVTSKFEVFIAGLPRSGTTLILEMLYGTDEFRTFTYRHMPFILSPLLWNRLSSSFHKTGTTMERAHGDGMDVSFDSPEAFEEIIWLFYMKEKIVSGDLLSPLSIGDQTPEFEKAFKNTIEKLLVDGGAEQPLRYLSKNNANISRIELIHRLFPSSVIIIPFRRPFAHVSSLIKQHRKFTVLHQEDGFSKRYMEWLGHYDFGENFKPINFDNWLDDEEDGDHNDENFWLKYWTAAYSHVLDNRTENVYLIDFDKLLTDGKNCLKVVADCVGLENKERLVKAANRLCSPTSRPLKSNHFLPETLESALQVHARLMKLAI